MARVTPIEAYLPDNVYRKGRPSHVNHLFIHFMSDCIRNPNNPYIVENVHEIFTLAKVSAHYTVDREGNVYALVREEDTAWHAGKGTAPAYPTVHDLNPYSIGIELFAIGTEEEMNKGVGMSTAQYGRVPEEHIGYTEAQYEALNLLVQDIFERHPKIPLDRKHVIGHDEYAVGRKYDPGSLFDWSRIGF